MSRPHLHRLASLVLGLALAIAPASVALAQSGEVAAALASGQVGEQADGYLGFVKAPSSALKSEVDAINIKRREAYTQVAQQKNVPIEAFAASIGCTTLSGLKPGRAYSVARGVWATKGAGPVTLPQACGG